MTNPSAPATIDEYIAAFPPEVQSILQKIRRTIQKVAPKAEETISYKMPAFAINGDRVYFAAFKKHVGLFPPVRGDEKLRKAIARYRGEKGNLRFPLDEPIPFDLIATVVQCRIKEHGEKIRTKKKKK